MHICLHWDYEDLLVLGVWVRMSHALCMQRPATRVRRASFCCHLALFVTARECDATMFYKENLRYTLIAGELACVLAVRILSVDCPCACFHIRYGESHWCCRLGAVWNMHLACGELQHE